MSEFKDTRLFFANEKYAGVYELESPLVPITVKNLQETWNSIRREEGKKKEGRKRNWYGHLLDLQRNMVYYGSLD